MLTPQSYFWSSLVFLVVLGAVLYVADRSFGVAIRRAFWNMTHDKRSRLPKEEERGFIYRRRARSRMNVAIVFALIETVMGIVVFRYNPFWELLNAVIDIPALMIGFYAGPYLDRIFGYVDRGLDQAEALEERIERGDTTLGAEVRGAARSTGTRIRETISPAGSGAATRTAAPPQSSTTAAEPEGPDPKAALDNFLGRK